MILDIFSESLSSHIKSENYNADYNSKDLITFCKCKAYKIYNLFLQNSSPALCENISVIRI